MPRGCTARAACRGHCIDQEMHDGYMRWLRYWDSLTDEGREREKQMMAAYTAEYQAERDRLGDWEV